MFALRSAERNWVERHAGCKRRTTKPLRKKIKQALPSQLRCSGLDTIAWSGTDFDPNTAYTLTYQIDTAYFSHIEVTSTPEPATLALLGIGLAGITIFRHRQ